MDAMSGSNHDGFVELISHKISYYILYLQYPNLYQSMYTPAKTNIDPDVLAP